MPKFFKDKKKAAQLGLGDPTPVLLHTHLPAPTAPPLHMMPSPTPIIVNHASAKILGNKPQRVVPIARVCPAHPPTTVRGIPLPDYHPTVVRGIPLANCHPAVRDLPQANYQPRVVRGVPLPAHPHSMSSSVLPLRQKF